MKIKAIVHEAEEGGLWGEIPALPGCVSQGETVEELIENLEEAARAWLASFDTEEVSPSKGVQVVELAL